MPYMGQICWRVSAIEHQARNRADRFNITECREKCGHVHISGQVVRARLPAACNHGWGLNWRNQWCGIARNIAEAL